MTPRPARSWPAKSWSGPRGGLGGPQTQPYLLYPATWELDLAPLIGVPMGYQQLRRWMERELGLSFGSDDLETGARAVSSARSHGAAGDVPGSATR